MSFTLDPPHTSPISQAPDLAQERVLFAFSEKDRAKFFPFHPGVFPGAGWRHWLDTTGMTSDDRWLECLRDLRPTVLVSCWSTPALPSSLLHDRSFPLRYFCHSAGTVRSKIPREFVVRGGIVTNWGNIISHNVAEHALLLILACLRNMPAWRPAIARGGDYWCDAQLLGANSLRGKKVGLHGIGNVAGELIRILKPFDVECRAFSQNVSPQYIQEKGAEPCADLKELFRASDVIVECEGLTPLTEYSVREEHFRLMPDGAVFVNVGRGQVVDERALAHAAAEGRIRVGLDVFAVEPLPAESPLLEMENVIISPHIAGPAGDWFHRCGDHALANVDRYLRGQSLSGLVTLEIYDRTT
jgi:phosphoglycerate dehydrogenase-like enzyme